ncbi:secretin N-terminal domain-containing protein [Methylomagnum sp.]
MGIPGRLSLAFLVLLGIGPLQADELAIIELRQRPAEELIPLIRPLLGPSDAIVPNHNQLIVRANPATVAEIRALLDQIDIRPHRLLITVAQGSQISGESSGAGAQIRGRINLDQPGDSAADIHARIHQAERQSITDSAQRVQTLDGSSAVIQMGTQIPVPSPYGYGADYRAATTGFAVTPRLAGGRVLLDIAPWSDRLESDPGGVINTQSAHTRLQVELGEWIEVGGAAETTSRDQNGLIGGGYSNQNRDSRIFLKVEDLDAGM